MRVADRKGRLGCGEEDKRWGHVWARAGRGESGVGVLRVESQGDVMYDERVGCMADAFVGCL